MMLLCYTHRCVLYSGSVKSLYEKHQLNPKNNGVNVIDYLQSYSLTSDKMGQIGLLSIRNNGKDRTFRLTVKDTGNIYIGQSTTLLVNGSWGNIQNQQLGISSKIGFVIDGKLCYKSIIDMKETFELYNYYSLITLDKSNYVLKNGLVVKSD